ncbi:hypothetical protein [Clostridium sp. AN503]|uniref:hypothetical protein n=1 Tax=Clostridium sp. AN503 TaxID=3160598 RepID=UPI00345B1C35
MELNINQPAYFKEHYGIDDEVHKFCQKAQLHEKYMTAENGKKAQNSFAIKVLFA